MIPVGNYEAVAVECVGLTTSSKGTMGIPVVFEIVGGSCAGERVKWTGWFTEKAKERTLESLAYMGLTNISDLTKVLPDTTRKYLPAKVSITVEHEPGQNDPTKLFAKVAWVNKLGGARVNVDARLDTPSMLAFTESLRGAFEAAKAGAGPVVAPPANSGKPAF